MKNDRFSQVGLDRFISLAWMEKASSLVLAGNASKDIKTILQEDLSGFFRSSRTDVRGSLDKTITILMKIWLTTPTELEAFRKSGLELLQGMPRQEQIAVHWGMILAVYPFWSGVATQVGRLLSLQSSVTAAQVQRRVREQYGERETVSRRARYALRSFVDWGAIKETQKKGVYQAASTLNVTDPSLTAWMIEAALHAQKNGSAPLKDVIRSPGLFPFAIRSISVDRLQSVNGRINIVRHGLDDDLVMLSSI